ncbi:LLM class flavin-dependent oxidoreductase [Amycolatopsis sp. CA-230715]|uniref:LLM class flavin-dependent oxidoreductase n=1 Tax=Amycolatopsis sp. CA-230715 TaxID=2745196 RepID=UPI001C00AF59|nr:LLM class flavin-dependent oxidoreductase [Amycolatopsis sp. CA-230715]QWF84788.1 Methanesulfonate monooxygenase [Amycolatopsis sp. CA-230715]
MSLHLHWFLPSHGDGRTIAKAANGAPARPPRRDPGIDYLAAVAQAAERFGFESVLTPFGLFCEDPWIVASALSQRTSLLKFMIALRPGFVSPLLVAQMSATLQRVSGGRLLFNVVTGGDADEQRRYGDRLDHDHRYQRTAELVDAVTRLWDGEPVDFAGSYYEMTAGLLTRPHPTRPPIFLGGSSGSAHEVAAKHADVYLAWGERPDGLTELMRKVRALADAQSRTLGFGTRFHVIARDSAEQAWAVADDIMSTLDPKTVENAQARFARTESEGQRRMAVLHGGSTDRLEVYPNVWMGYGLARPGAGATLVGSHREVADRLTEYHRRGLDHFILSGQPHLEEAYWFGEGVLPILRERGLLEPEQSTDAEPNRRTAP